MKTADAASGGLRDVPWRWYDGLVGVGVLLPTHLTFLYLADLPAAWRLWIVRLPFVVRWAVIFLFPHLWWVGYPLAAARARLPGFRVRWPSAEEWARESTVAVLVTVVLCAAIAGYGAVSALSHGWLQAKSVWGPGPGGAMLSATNQALLLASAVLLAPLTEEVFFRGLLYNWLKRFCPRWAALLLQAAVFALFHPFGPDQLLLVFAAAVVLGGVYEWRQTLLTPILVHAFRNAVGAAAVAWLGQL